MNIESLLRAVRFREAHYRAVIANFEADAGVDPMAALNSRGHDAVVAKANLAAMDEAEKALRQEGEMADKLIGVIAFAANLASSRGRYYDVIRQLEQDARREAYARIARDLVQSLSA